MKYLKRFKIFENKKFCGECGSELGLKDRFCDQCGTKQDMVARPKSDDEKSVLAKLNDDKVDLKEKIDLIISTYEGDLIQHLDFDKKASDVIGEYQKKYKSDILNDESYKKAVKLSKKSLLIGTIESHKAKSTDPEYRKMLDSLMDEFHDKDVDDYDTSSAFTKALLLDTANMHFKREKGKPWKEQYLSIANSYQKGSNSTTIMGQMLVLDMVVSVAHKYPEHKAEFEKIFQDYLKTNKSDYSNLLSNVYAKEAEIKKQKNGGSKLRFDSSGKEIK